MRKVLIGVAVFVVAVALVILIGPHLIPADRLKQDLARQVEAATGRTLSIDGDLSFTLLPAPGVSIGGVRLSNVEGAAAPDMLQLDRVTAVVSLLPLLGGAIEVDRIILVRPRIELEQLADGRASWRFATPPSETRQPAAGAGGVTSSDGGAPAVQLNRVVISDGSLTWRSGTTVETITGIDTFLMAQSLQGPFQLDGSLTARGMPLKLRVTAGELAVDRAIPLSVSATAEGIDFAVNGFVSGYPNEARLSGRLEARVADAGATMAAIGGTPAPAALAGKAAALEGTLAANLSAANLSINDLSARFGDINATGALDIGGGETPHVDLVLNAGQIDLDALLAAAAPRQGRTAGTAAGNQGAGNQGNGRGGAAAPSDGSTPAAAGDAELPSGIAGTVELKVENILFRGGVLRQARLAAEIANGALTVSQLSAQLPGGSDVSLFGFIETPRGAPVFNGQVEANSDDLRALLGWLAVDVGAVPAERLRKLTASSAIRASASNVTVTDLDLAIDTMRLRGGVAVALRERPGFGIGLSLDKINLDAYLPHDAGTASTASPVSAAGAAAGGAAAGTADGDGRGIAALADFDAIVQVKVGEVTWRGTAIHGVNVDATLQGGNLDLRDASVAGLGGAKARFAGKLDDVASAPRADLTLSVAATDANALLRLAGVTPPVAVGAAQLDGTLSGDFDNLRLDVALQALQATANVNGTLKQPLAALAYDLRLDVSHAEAARLFALLAGAAPGATTLGAFSLKGTLAGSADAATFDLATTVGAGSAALTGAMKGLAGAASGNVSLKATHPDLAGVIRAFDPEFRPALSPLGGFDIETAALVDADTVRLDTLAGKAGPVEYKGSGALAFGGERPKLTANLATSEIIVDWFLPAVSGDKPAPAGGAAGAGAGAPGGGGRATAPGERWSRAPIDLSALRALDAEIALTAPAIAYSDIRIDTPKLAATLADGTLDLRDLSGGAFGGSFTMTGRAVAAEVPQLRYTLHVKDTDAAAFVKAGQDGPAMMGALELLFPVASLQLVSGKLGADIDVRAVGRSEFELVSHLDGTGAMTLTDAVVDGIDTCAISRQLGQLNGLPGFLALIGSARGGRTRVANYAGSYTLAGGVATLPQQSIKADCGVASFAGAVDLPRWTIDLTARATFPDHAKFPGLVIEQKGSLDAPDVRLVNSNAVQQYIIGNAAESLIRKLVPQSGQSASPPATSGGQASGQSDGQAPSTKPADQFRNLLDGLIRR